jgi:hypothetical protein
VGSTSKIDLGQTLNTLANVGVIAGIVCLALQLNQTNEMVRAQTRAGITEATIRNIEMYREPRIMSAFQRARSGQTLTADESFLLDNSSNATLRMWENNYYQYEAGLFDRTEFEADLAGWRQILRDEPEFVVHWQSKRLSYSAEFREVIDQIIDELL